MGYFFKSEEEKEAKRKEKERKKQLESYDKKPCDGYDYASSYYDSGSSGCD